MKQYELPVTKPVFRIKGGTLSATVLELGAINPAALERQLAEKVAQAPQLFQHSPLVIALDKLGVEDGPLDLAGLLDTCRRHTLHPVGVRATRPDDLAQAASLGIAVLPGGRTRERELPAALAANHDGGPESPLPLVPELSAELQQGNGAALNGAENNQAPAHSDPALADPNTSASAAGELRPSRVVTQPVRGGQQIYVPGDLVLLAPVSAGAEVMADGHIHVYAPLRGRALAGVQGDTGARIFCRELSAELIAIAGHFRIADDLRAQPLWGRSAQVCLEGDELKLISL
ncbi:MAG: minC [Moraxellaceae bacterium]|jgi:septum site-determining protein MinC|nr:minC [Moraxellaceae bacterium]